VLGLMAEGRSNAAIAGALFVTEKAVSKHTNSIFTKLDLPVDGDDNRRVLVTLTKKGLRFLEKVASVNFRHLGSSSRTLSNLSRILS